MMVVWSCYECNVQGRPEIDQVVARTVLLNAGEMFGIRPSVNHNRSGAFKTRSFPTHGLQS